MALGLYELINNINKQIKSICCKVNALLDSGAGSYKVYTALLTQSGGSSETPIDSGLLTIGITYWIVRDSPGMDFTNVGAPNNNIGTYFVATGTTPNSWGSLSGTGNDTISYDPGAPVVTVLENTIGNIWFEYNNTGFYTIKSNSLFTTNKTTFFMGIMDNNSGQPIIGTDHFANDESTYQIFITDQSGGFQNEFFYNTAIEIRVYN